MRFQRFLAALSVVGFLSLSTACGTSGKAASDDPAGALQVTVANVTSVPGVERIQVEATGPTSFETVFAMNDRKEWTTFRGNLRVGNYHVKATALGAADEVLYESDWVPTEVKANETAVVNLVLNPVEDGQGPDNHVPYFEFIASDRATVVPGGQVEFNVQVNDRDGDALTLSAQGCDGDCSDVVGSFFPAVETLAAAAPGTARHATMIWTAPETEGLYQIEFRVEDEHEASSTAQIEIQVGAARGAIAATIRVNFAPVVEKIAVAQEQGDTIHLTATATDDHDDVAVLGFAWENDATACTGTFSDAAAASTTFTVTGFVDASDSCSLTLTVTDLDGAKTVTKIYVEKERFELTFAPALFLRFQSQDDAEAGDVLVFEVEAEVVGTEDVDFAWVVPGAAADFTQDDDALVSTLTWTVPSSVPCEPGDVVTISATATGVASGKSSEPVEFQVAIDPSICE